MKLKQNNNKNRIIWKTEFESAPNQGSAKTPVMAGKRKEKSGILREGEEQVIQAVAEVSVGPRNIECRQLTNRKAKLWK